MRLNYLRTRSIGNFQTRKQRRCSGHLFSSRALTHQKHLQVREYSATQLRLAASNTRYAMEQAPESYVDALVSIMAMFLPR